LKKALEALIELQEIDCGLQKLEQAKGDLPQRVNSLSEEVRALEKEIAEKKEKNSELKKRRVEISARVEDLKVKLQKYQKQLYSVKTNKEYDALTLEIDTTKETQDQLEFEILEIDEATATLDEEIVALEQKTAELKEELEHARAELDAMMAKTRDEEQALNAKREQVLKRLSQPLISTYNRIRVNRGGRALALLKDGAYGSCSECSTRIPPQRSLEIRMMNKIYTCEVCGRILVWRPDTDGICRSTEDETKETESMEQA